MAHIDIDTTELAAAGLRAGDTAALLAGLTAGRVTTHDAARAAGDPVLAAGIEDLLAAWAPTHRTLVSTLEQLAAGLRQAAELYETAEGTTVDGVARAVLAASVGEPAGGRTGGPSTDRAL
jgi:hypothetical protein